MVQKKKRTRDRVNESQLQYYMKIIFTQSISPCSLSLVTCGFENSGLCGWTQDASDQFDWSKGTGNTASLETGPKSDKTYETGYGKCCSMESLLNWISGFGKCCLMESLLNWISGFGKCCLMEYLLNWISGFGKCCLMESLLNWISGFGKCCLMESLLNWISGSRLLCKTSHEWYCIKCFQLQFSLCVINLLTTIGCCFLYRFCFI